MTSPERPSPTETTQRFRIEGRVQGVGFRMWARSRASSLGLDGYVRNHEDGSVELVAAGPPPALRALREALNGGPPGASVVRVAEEPAPPHTDPGFRIRR